MSIWMKFATNVSPCCRVARSSFEEDSDKRHELHWSGWSRHSHGDQRLGMVHFAALYVAPETPWPCQSGQGRVVPQVCQVHRRAHKNGTRHTFRTPSSAVQRERARRSNWRRFPERGSVWQGRLWLQGREETHWLLQARRPQIVVRELPEEVRAFEPHP